MLDLVPGSVVQSITARMDLNTGHTTFTVRCADRRSVARADRFQPIVDDWLAGLSQQALAEKHGISVNALNVTFVKLRADGFPVPRRRSGGKKWRDPVPVGVNLTPGYRVPTARAQGGGS